MEKGNQENENLVVEETTENVGEQATEEVVNSEETTTDSIQVEEEKKYSEAEMNEILAKKKRNMERKLRREYEKKYSVYSELGNVVGAGLGTSDMQEATKKLKDYYEGQGVNIPTQRNFTDREEQILARADAEDIINSGYEDIVEEVNRLTEVGVDKMTAREKLIFKALAEKRQEIESEKELLSIGADKEVLNSKEYKSFIKNNGLEAVSAKKAYELFRKIQPKPQVEQIGDLTNKNSKEVKTEYTDEEIAKLSLDELDDPVVWKNVRKSMTQRKE